MKAMIKSTEHLTCNSNKRMKMTEALERKASPGHAELMQWKTDDLLVSTHGYSEASSLLQSQPGRPIHIGAEESLLVSIDGMHLYQLNAETNATNSTRTLKKMDESLRKLIWFLLNIGEVDATELQKPGSLLWSLSTIVLRSYESVIVTAGHTPGSTSNKKQMGNGIAFRKTFFSNLQGLFHQGSKSVRVPGMRILNKYTAAQLLATMPADMHCDETDVKKELQDRLQNVGRVARALANGASGDLEDLAQKKKLVYKPEAGSWDMMSNLQFTRLWDHTESELQKLCKVICEIGFEDTGKFKGEGKLIDRWFCLMQVFLLIAAGGQRPGTVAIISCHEEIMRAQGQEKAVRRMRHVIEKDGECAAARNPELYFYGSAKTIILFHTDKMRKAAALRVLERLGGAANTSANEKFQQLLNSFGRRLLFRTDNGEDIDSTSIRRSIRREIYHLGLFSKDDLSKTQKMIDGKTVTTYKASRAIATKISSRAIRRMVATNRFLKFQKGKLCKGMKVWEFLAKLATVMNTSVECLVRDYIRVPVQDYSEQQQCYTSVFEGIPTY